MNYFQIFWKIENNVCKSTELSVKENYLGVEYPREHSGTSVIFDMSIIFCSIMSFADESVIFYGDEDW